MIAGWWEKNPTPCSDGAITISPFPTTLCTLLMGSSNGQSDWGVSIDKGRVGLVREALQAKLCGFLTSIYPLIGFSLLLIYMLCSKHFIDIAKSKNIDERQL